MIYSRNEDDTMLDLKLCCKTRVKFAHLPIGVLNIYIVFFLFSDQLYFQEFLFRLIKVDK